ncbi:MAG: sigma-70 family RNA polymerase sigma factor [Myxococcota bacterium]
MSVSDGELLAKWRNGEQSAGEALFDKYYSLIERFFLNKVTAAVEVADLVQECFLACVSGRERIREDSKFRSYLFSVAHRILQMHLRKKYRTPQAVNFEEVSVRDLSPRPSSLVARRREQRLLLESLRSIPVDYQVVLELHYWEKLTTQDIADVVNMPLGTVRSRLRRARELLEQAMSKLASSPDELKSTITRLDDWAERCRQGLLGGELIPG